jgi:membrane protein required for colicin V production
MDLAITIVILLIVVFFLVDGVRRGLVRQLFEIVGLIAAFIAAYFIGHALAHHFEGSTRISYPVVLFFFSAVVFVAVVLVFHLMGLALQKIVDVTILSPVDRIGGGAFGVLKGVLFVSLLCVLLSGIPSAEGFRHRLASNRVASVVHPVLPRVYHFIMKRWFPGHADPGTLVRARSLRDIA